MYVEIRLELQLQSDTNLQQEDELHISKQYYKRKA